MLGRMPSTISISVAMFATTCAFAQGELDALAPSYAACDVLADMRLADGTIDSAEIVEAGAFQPPAEPESMPNDRFAGIPAFCRVHLTLTPTVDSDIKSEVWLPLTSWNSKYVGVGNGAWAGSIAYGELAQNVERFYATAATDTGHSGGGQSAEWAVGHPEKLVDYGYRAVHVTTVAAKVVVNEFYGRTPDLSLWDSCSTGGRQGLMAAHRYPEDFDAISAMAPNNPMTDIETQTMWIGWQAQRYGVELGPQQLGLVHRAALEQCDVLDGVQDGIVGLPLSCGFQPASLQCGPNDATGECLSSGQVRAMEAIYDGVRASDGTLLLPGWPRGSESLLWFLTAQSEPSGEAMSYFRDLVFRDREDWDWRTTDYRTYFEEARAYGADILDVPPDGLAAYFNRGGKLLLSHGWSDVAVPAANTLEFFDQLYDSLPAQQREDQLRLFMAPGMNHCGLGEGPSEIDTLGELDAWATTGDAPSEILATRPTQLPPLPGLPPTPPREPMERPLCAWPALEVYDGEGDPMVADSFRCARP
jgi:hypothetical protein